MKKGILFLIFSICLNSTFSQIFGNSEEVVKYDAAKVLDPVYGITMYEKMNPQIGGYTLEFYLLTVSGSGRSSAFLT